MGWMMCQRALRGCGSVGRDDVLVCVGNVS